MRLADVLENYGATFPLSRPRAGVWLAIQRARLIVNVVRSKAEAESVFHWEAEHPDAQELIDRLEEKYTRYLAVPEQD